MAVSSVKIEFVFDDKFSGPLKNAANNLNGMNRALSNMGSTAALANINKQVSEINASLGGVYGTLTKFAGAWKALGTLGNVFNAAFGGIFEYAKAFETNAIGISGILASMTTLNGKQTEWNQALGISKDIMKQLRVAALQTAATSTDLIDTFRGLLGPGLGAGMKINEIIEFTKVGVNAVKSMGLPSNQFLQELRGLEQGGIRASSSTLATALGLKDADIKKAINSSEGLFKFLMNRLKGFAQATDATAGTMQGQIEILKEAVMGIGADAGESIFKSYSKALGKINDLLLTKNPTSGVMEINPEIVEKVKSVVDVIDSALSKVAAVGEYVANKWQLFTGVIIAMEVAPKVFEAISSALAGVGNRAVNVADALFKQEDIVKRLAEEYRVTALSAISEKEKEVRTQISLNREYEKTAKTLQDMSKVDKVFGAGMSKAVSDLQAKMRALGLSSSEAAAKVNQYLNSVKSANAEQRKFAIALWDTVEKLYQEKQAAEAAANKGKSFWEHTKTGCNVLSQFSGALSGAAMALAMTSNEQDTWARSLSDGLFVVDATISAVGGLSNALSSLTAWWKTVDAASRIALANMGIAAAGIMAIAGVGYGIYSRIEHYNKYGNAGFKVSEDGQEVEMVNPYDNISKGASASRRAAEHKDRVSNELFVQNQNKKGFGNIGLLHPRQEEVDKAAKKTADKAARELKQATKQYETLENALKVSVAKSSNHYSALQEKNAEILKQDEAWSQKIKEMAEKGVETAKINEITQLKDKAIKEQYLAAERDFNQKLNDMQLDKAKNTMLLGGSQEEQYTAVDDALQTRKFMLEMMLADENLAADARIQIEQRYADTVKQIRDNSMYNFKSAWQATLQEMSQQQINYGESIKSVFSSIESAGTNLLTSTENFGQRIKTFFSDIASSIMQEMSKLIMKALITNVLLKAFGGLFGGGSIGSTSFKSAMSGSKIDLSQTSASYGLGGSLIGGFAKGGYASGWSIVGEKGPELVNFSDPARVYTAQQTRNALSGGAGNVNIKIDLKNESGQQLEAETTGSNFDGENYIVGVVLKAINTNKYGIRTTMKGLANA